jgi:hypothetical protein
MCPEVALGAYRFGNRLAVTLHFLFFILKKKKKKFYVWMVVLNAKFELQCF